MPPPCNAQPPHYKSEPKFPLPFNGPFIAHVEKCEQALVDLTQCARRFGVPIPPPFFMAEDDCCGAIRELEVNCSMLDFVPDIGRLLPFDPKKHWHYEILFVYY